MADFDFKLKADWNSGFKNNVVGDDDAPSIDVDKLAIAPEFFDPIAGGSRKPGWTEHVSGISSITDKTGTPDYMEVIQEYSGRYAHVQRPPTAGMLPPNASRLTLQCHLKAIDDNNTIHWNPGAAIYWNVNNWCRIRFDMASNKMVVEANINGTVYDLTVGTPFAISLSTWYEVLIRVFWDGSVYFCEAWCRVPHTSWFPIGGSIPVPFWNFNPTWLIFGSGFSDEPSYPIPDFNNSTLAVDAQKKSHMSMFGIWPLNGHAGSWQSPSIPVAADKQLKEVILEHDYGTANAHIDKVNILRASDDVVLSTWTGIITGDQTLSESDFDNGLDITKGVNSKVEVWLWSTDGLIWSELDRVAGNLQLVWHAQETLGLSEKGNAEVETPLSETLGLSDKDIADIEALFEETLGMSDVHTVNAVLAALETLGFTDTETVDLDILIAESLGLSDHTVADIDIWLYETLGLSEDVFQMTQVLAGIKGIIAPLLDITDFDFCQTVIESGHVVTKKGTPDESFQAYFYRKQTSQRFDVAIETFPGDAVMFYCPDVEVTIAVGDTLEHNSLEYEVIAIRKKPHDGNPIYYKAACRFQRDVGVPQVINPAGTSPAAGQALVTWDEVETTQYPAFDYYELWMQKGAGTYQLITETAGVSHTQRNLAAATYKFKIRAIDKAGLQGTFSSEVSVVVT